MNKPIFRYYCFDIDDNILITSTKLHMEHFMNGIWTKKDISTKEYAKINNCPNWRTTDNTYVDFGDFGSLGEYTFLEDVKKAISNRQFGPSWNTFINCIINGNIFSIISARGHETISIRYAIEYIIWNILTLKQRKKMYNNLIKFNNIFGNSLCDFSYVELINNYLDSCYFIGVTSPSFLYKYNHFDYIKPEHGKIIALKNFINKIKSYHISINADIRIGFSDDDIKNIKEIQKIFEELSQTYNDISFSIINTSNPNIIGGIKKRINSIN
jgi:hypothetical protein